MLMIIKLESWEYEYASTIGIRRYTNNWGKPDAPHYDPNKMEDNRTALVAAAIGELAVAKPSISIGQPVSGKVQTIKSIKTYLMLVLI